MGITIFDLLKKNKLNICIFLLVFGVLFPVMYRFSLINLDPHHQGFMFKTAYDVAHGRTLFKETFNMYGALTIYIQAVFIYFFGDTIAVLNMSACLALCVAYYIFYLIIKRFTNIGVALVSVLVIFGMDYIFTDTFHPWSSVYALMILAMMIYALIVFIDTEKNRYLYLFSSLTALSFWARQPVGVVMFFGMLMTAAVLHILYKPIRIHTVIGCISSYISVHLLFLIKIILDHSLEDFYIQSIKGVFGFNEIKNTDGNMLDNMLDCLFPNERNIIWSVIPILLLLSFFAVFGKCVLNKRKGIKNEKIWVMLMIFIIFSVASWHQYYPVPCNRHIFWAAVPMIGCFCTVIYLFSRFFCNAVPVKLLQPFVLTIIIIACSFGNYIFCNIESGIQKLSEPRTVYKNDNFEVINGLYLTDEQADFQNKFAEVMVELEQKYPDKNVANLTLLSTYTFFQKYNFHPEFFPLEHIDYDYHSIVTAYVEEELPIIICYEKDWEYWGYAGYMQYAEITGDDSDLYFNYQDLGIYIPVKEQKEDILKKMYTDQDIEINAEGVLLNESETYSYGTRYYVANGDFKIYIEIECEDNIQGVLQVWEDWHTNLAQEEVLENGINEVTLDGNWDNATLSIYALNGNITIKKVELISKYHD